jgi:hypothetical protein
MHAAIYCVGVETAGVKSERFKWLARSVKKAARLFLTIL